MKAHYLICSQLFFFFWCSIGRWLVVTHSLSFRTKLESAELVIETADLLHIMVSTLFLTHKFWPKRANLRRNLYPSLFFNEPFPTTLEPRVRIFCREKTSLDSGKSAWYEATSLLFYRTGKLSVIMWSWTYASFWVTGNWYFITGCLRFTTMVIVFDFISLWLLFNLVLWCHCLKVHWRW